LPTSLFFICRKGNKRKDLVKEMLISEDVEIRISCHSKDHYEKLGYEIPKGKNGSFSSKTKITVKVSDLLPKSNVDIILKCDYCGKTFTRRYADHTFIKSKNIIDKDCCSECAFKKFEESYVLEHGVTNPFALGSVKEKIKNYNIENFGVENPMDVQEIKDRQKQTCIEKYGVDNVSKSEVVKNRIVATIQDRYGVDNIMELEEYRLKIAETLSKNNSISTSKQQKYIHKLIGGLLNYSYNTPVLDIAFPDEKIYVEYNGGGHDLKVKLGINTDKEFKNKELRRYHYLKDNGWKAIFIDSANDLLPSNNIIIELINIGKEYLKHGNWIKFDIDNNIIIKDKEKEFCDYGSLRKIKDKDLEEVS
jgi:hypothetical protein